MKAVNDKIKYFLKISSKIVQQDTQIIMSILAKQLQLGHYALCSFDSRNFFLILNNSRQNNRLDNTTILTFEYYLMY